MKKIFIFIIVLLSVFSFISCKEEVEVRTGSLCVNTQVSSKTIYPDIDDITVSSYTVSGLHSDGVTSFTKDFTEASVTIDKLLIGTWNITIEGKNEAKLAVVSQTQEVEIVPAQEKTVNFKLSKFSGIGTLSFSVKWPINISSVFKFEAIIQKGEDVEAVFAGTREDATQDDEEYVITQSRDLDTGSYVLTVILRDLNGKQVGAPILDTIHIYKDMTTTAVIEFPENYFPVDYVHFSIEDSSVVLNTPISLWTTTSGATIYYTTDGSNPSDSETRIAYTEPIVVSSPFTLKAIAMHDDMVPSSVETKNYTLRVKAPVLILDEEEQIVHFRCETPNSVFYYTVDGSTPTKGNGIKSDSFQILKNTDLKVVATYGDWDDSDVVSAEYKVTTDLLCSLPSGVYVGEQEVSLSSSTLNALIYYTTDGTEPTTESTLYEGDPIVIGLGVTTLKVLAISPTMEAVLESWKYEIPILSSSRYGIKDGRPASAF